MVLGTLGPPRGRTIVLGNFTSRTRLEFARSAARTTERSLTDDARPRAVSEVVMSRLPAGPGLGSLSLLRMERPRGQALPEFALVLPLLALLLFGTIQFGIIFGGYIGLINSVREAARFGSVCIGPTTTCGPSTESYLRTQKIPGSVMAYKGTPVAKVEYQAYQDGSTPVMWNTRIRVSGCVTSIVFIPLIGSVLGLADVSAFPLKSVETFRVEGQPSVAVPAGLPPDGSWTVAAAGAC